MSYPYLVLFPHIRWFLPVPFPMSNTLFCALVTHYGRPSWKSPIQHRRPVIGKMSLADGRYFCKTDLQWRKLSFAGFLLEENVFCRITECYLYIFICIFVKISPRSSIKVFILPQVRRFVEVMLQCTFFIQNTDTIQKIYTQCSIFQPV